MRVTKMVENAAANRDYPFEELVRYVNRSDGLSRAPIFQVVLVLCNVPFCISEVPTVMQLKKQGFSGHISAAPDLSRRRGRG